MTSKTLVEHAVFVSNVGQIRNFALLRHQLGLSNILLFILYTRHNRRLLHTLNVAAANFGFASKSILLPRSPNSALPWTLNQIRRTYDGILRKFRIENLWLCNINSHYGYMAAAAFKQGTKVNYFEEGLGTYLRADEPPYRSDRVSGLNHLLARVIPVLQDSRIDHWRKIRRAAFEILQWHFESPAGALTAGCWTFGASKHFRHPWRRFESAYVVFPHKLDSTLIRAKAVFKLNLGVPESTGIKLRDCSTLLLHQPYGFEPTLWVDALAAALIARGLFTLCVKFHPRDAPKFRKEVLERLRTWGIEANHVGQLDHVPVENLVFCGNLGKVVGITSTALAYGSEIAKDNPRYRELEFVSIAPFIIDYLENELGKNDKRLVTLRSHYTVLSRCLS